MPGGEKNRSGRVRRLTLYALLILGNPGRTAAAGGSLSMRKRGPAEKLPKRHRSPE
jgi:hypothetical protein